METQSFGAKLFQRQVNGQLQPLGRGKLFRPSPYVELVELYRLNAKQLKQNAGNALEIHRSPARFEGPAFILGELLSITLTPNKPSFLESIRAKETAYNRLTYKTGNPHKAYLENGVLRFTVPNDGNLAQLYESTGDLKVKLDRQTQAEAKRIVQKPYWERLYQAFSPPSTKAHVDCVEPNPNSALYLIG